MSDPSATAAWQALLRHAQTLEHTRLRDLFARDPGRFERFSRAAAGLFCDYSKQRVTDETLGLLLALADAVGLPGRIQAMFDGARVNATERRAALHVALRNRGGRPIRADGENVMPAVDAVLAQMETFVQSVHRGQWRGHTGRRITDVVNIGIGGSDLGPVMATEALRPYWQDGVRPHFVSNVDGAHLRLTLERLDPQTTLFVVVSKTFTTLETLTNARAARDWLVAAAGEGAVARHFVAVSTNAAGVAAFGIAPENMFVFWDWVGGRYSLWSAAGLSIALTVGMPNFLALLAGAHDMDEHFRLAAPADNLPVLLGLIGVWNRNFLRCATHAVLPYDQLLHRLPAYLQQLEMESNGKRVRLDGQAADCDTCPVVWGEPGTNGQHAFYQLLHQGTQAVPADFIAAVEPAYPLGDQHDMLLANCLAQSEALMAGKTEDEARDEMARQGLPPDEARRLAPHRAFPGNRPSTTLLVPRLTPRSLGALVALYEHKVFVQGTIWGVNSFDQWGVELGKQLAGRILPELAGDAPVGAHDASTLGLIRHIRGGRAAG